MRRLNFVQTVVMKGFYSLLALSTALALAGCGGSSSSSSSNNSIAPGFYRGVFEVVSDGWINGAAPMFVDVEDRNNFRGEALSDSYYAVLIHSPKGSFLHEGIAVEGSLSVTKTATGFNFIFTNGSGIDASGELQPAPLPELGGTASVPEAGNYIGKFLMVREGRARSMGTVEASVDGDGNFTGFTEGGSVIFIDPLFAGKFEADGTLSGAQILSQGNTYTMGIPPAYSYDGITLIAKYEFDGNEFWLTLTPALPKE